MGGGEGERGGVGILRQRNPAAKLPVVQMALPAEKSFICARIIHFIADTDTDLDENMLLEFIFRSRYRHSCSLQF